MKKIIYILTFMLNAKVGSSKSTIKKKKMDVDELTDELTIYIIPPPYPLNFRSPGSLAKSLWKNAIVCMFRKYKHPMGHLVVHLASKEKGHDIYTGSIMKNKFHAFFTIIRTGMGYGTMLHSFKGKEDDEKKVYKEIEERKAKGNITFVKFKLDSSTYNKLYNFYQDCKDIELHKNYGAALDPLKGEGAGCSSYGVSFIQIAGLLDTDITDQWKHTLLLPHILMKKEKRVSLLKIFMHNRWAKEGEEMTTLDIFDPGLMHKWVKEKDDESSVTSGKSEGVQYHYTAEY